MSAKGSSNRNLTSWWGFASLVVGLLLTTGAALLALDHEERVLWVSALSEMSYVQVERELARPELDPEELEELPVEERFEQLPSEVMSTLGPYWVDYGSFLGVRVSPEDLPAVEAELIEAGLQYWTLAEEQEWQPHAAQSGAAAKDGVVEIWSAHGIRQSPVAGRFLVEVAYPVEESWIEGLEACGVEVGHSSGTWTLSIQAASLQILRECPQIDRIRRIASAFNTDRIAPELLDAEQAQWDRGWWLEYPASTTGDRIDADLPAGAEVVDDYVGATSRLVRVLIDRPGLAQLVESSISLLGVTPVGKASPSDERQGQILAGNHNGSSVTSPGYRTWLNNRGLLSSTNQQTVAVFDTGYDDGTYTWHHPDLSNPKRLVDANYYVGSGYDDPSGHGTVVAGIVAGDGSSGVGTGATDPQGFAWGTGIAPASRIVAIKLFDSSPAPACSSSSAAENLQTLQIALNYARNDSYGYDKALLANNSWNFRGQNQSYYNAHAQFYDERVLDASTAWAGKQPMTIVFSAGNAGYFSGAPTSDTIRSPAVAKNVITVGATENFRPSSQSGQPPNACQGYVSPLLQDATHIARIARISSRGVQFGPYPAAVRLEDVRVKPDVVAPGVRITSTVPYASEATYDCWQNICAKYFPSGAGHQYHSYGIGTSFAAPATTGAAALKRKWFLDRGVAAAPSLIKAAMIATADDLGSFNEYNGDHRPSWHYGWGRVNLRRLTDGAARFYVNESSWMPILTGTTKSWTRTIDNASKGTFIVLVWSDQPSQTALTSQVPLVNHLSLRVDDGGSARFWRGNNLRENKDGVDDGFSHPFVVGGDPILTDSMNNIEVVFIPGGTLPAGTQLTLRVTGDNVPNGPQLFSLYAYNLRLSS